MKLNKLHLFLIVIFVLLASSLGFSMVEYFQSEIQPENEALKKGDNYDPFNNGNYSSIIGDLEDVVIPERRKRKHHHDEDGNHRGEKKCNKKSSDDEESSSDGSGNGSSKRSTGSSRSSRQRTRIRGFYLTPIWTKGVRLLI